jgi:hypothetical protein
VDNTQLFYRSVPRHLHSGAVLSEKKLETARREHGRKEKVDENVCCNDALNERDSRARS